MIFCKSGPWMFYWWFCNFGQWGQEVKSQHHDQIEKRWRYALMAPHQVLST